MSYKKDTGKYGEDQACKFLERKKYKIIERNFLCRQGEIDIIAKSSKNELVFVEVKTRSSLNHGMPCEAVTPKKIKNIINSARYYIYKNRLYNIDIRFDVIEIFLHNNKCIIHHIKSAF